MSIWDDTFTGSDGDPPDSTKWEVVTNTNDAYKIASNTLALNYNASPYAPANTYVDIRGKYYLTGDFDIQISCVRYTGASSGSILWRTLEVISEDETKWAGVGYYLGGGEYGFFPCDDTGSLTPHNRIATRDSGTDNPEIVRITRSGSTIIVWRWDAGNSRWEGAWNDTAGWSARSISGNVRVRLAAYVPSGKQAWWTLDNFAINSGDAEALPLSGESPFFVGVEAEAEAEAEYHVVIDEGAGVKSESDASSPYVVEDEDIGIKAESDVSGIYNSYHFDTARVKSESDGFLMDAYILEGAGVKTESDIEKESYAVETVEAVISADADAYNYSAWMKANGSKATKVFIFTLTGSADGVDDINIPISSFQARKKNGDPTYLSVVIPTFNNSAEISARPNGDMVISAGYMVNGAVTLLEEILRGTLSDITSYDGPRSQSITLTGYKTKTFSQKTVSIDKENFTFVNSGKTRRRFSEVDLFLNPGDLLTVDAGTFEVGEISYTVNTNQQDMEVIEA